MEKAKPFAAFWVGLISAVGYGIFARLAFGIEQFSTLFGTISVGFLFFVPLALGALTVYFPAHGGQPSWPYAIFAPWAPCFLFAVLAAIFSWRRQFVSLWHCRFFW